MTIRYKKLATLKASLMWEMHITMNPKATFASAALLVLRLHRPAFRLQGPTMTLDERRCTA